MTVVTESQQGVIIKASYDYTDTPLVGIMACAMLVTTAWMEGRGLNIGHGEGMVLLCHPGEDALALQPADALSLADWLEQATKMAPDPMPLADAFRLAAEYVRKAARKAGS